ncbi:hypothetical protein THAOC_29480, partial [Thalassiosira oceanica]
AGNETTRGTAAGERGNEATTSETAQTARGSSFDEQGNASTVGAPSTSSAADETSPVAEAGERSNEAATSTVADHHNSDTAAASVSEDVLMSDSDGGSGQSSVRQPQHLQAGQTSASYRLPNPDTSSRRAPTPAPNRLVQPGASWTNGAIPVHTNCDDVDCTDASCNPATATKKSRVSFIPLREEMDEDETKTTGIALIVEAPSKILGELWDWGRGGGEGNTGYTRSTRVLDIIGSDLSAQSQQTL